MFLNFNTDGSDPSGPPPSRAAMILGIDYVLLFIALVFLSARIFVKAKLGKLGLDDVLIIIASLLTLSLLVLTSFAIPYGFAMHTRDIKPEWVLPYGKISYASVAIATVCLSFTKVSMILFYLQLATERTYRIVCYLSIAYITLCSTSSLLVNLFGCAPISGAWDRRASNPSVCITTSGFYFYSNITNVVTDIMLLVLPIPILLRLRLEWKVKLGLIAMFSMGFLITGVSGISMWKLYIALHSKDIIWDGAMGWMWTMAEYSVGIMTACMPGMKLFVTWMRGEKVQELSGEVTIGGGGGVRHPVGVLMMDSNCMSVFEPEYAIPEKEVVVHATELVSDAYSENGSRGV